MGGLLTATKVAVLATLVGVYWRPEFVLELGGAQTGNVQTHALRFVLTMGSYSLSLTFSRAFVKIAVAVLLQTAFWGLYLKEERFVGAKNLDMDAEKELYQLGAVACFAFLMSLVFFGAGTSADEPEQDAEFRKRLVAFYTKHNPTKLDQVETLLVKYKGNEDLLFTRLHRKYNSVTVEQAVAATDAFNDDDFVYEEEDTSMHEDQGEDEEEKTQATTPREEASQSENDEDYEVVKTYSSELDMAPTTSRTSSAVRAAIEDARRAQEQRVQQRIAQLTAQSSGR